MNWKTVIVLCLAVSLLVLAAMVGIFKDDDVPPQEESEWDIPEMVRAKSGGELVLIPGGKFSLQTGDGAVTVKVSPFYMDRYPVIQSDFERVMGYNPSDREDPDAPVEQLRWREAAEFCNKSSELEGLEPAYCPDMKTADFDAHGFRLPTEAEWVHAARGGRGTRYFFGESADRLGQYAWYRRNSGGRTRPVGQKLPNPFGLYDILGNVWEWCNDWYGSYGFDPSGGGVIDPRGPEAGEEKVLRGGAFDSSAPRLEITFRYRDFPDYGDVCDGYESYGFRRVLPVEAVKQLFEEKRH